MGRLRTSLIIGRERGLIPAALVPAPLTGLAKVELRYMVNGQKCENVWHFKKDTAWTDTELGTLATQLNQAFYDNFRPLCSEDLTMLEAKATDLSVHDGDSVTNLTHTGTAGSIATHTGSTFDAITLKLGTGHSGRQSIGYKRMPGIPDTDYFSEQLTSGAYSAWVSAANAFLGQLTGYGLSLVVASFFKNKAARVTPLATPVIEAIVGPNVTSQNSRKIGRGD